MHRDELARVLDEWLQPGRYKDVAENGLQVAGKDQVRKVVCGVSANLDLIDKAVAEGADAIFVHHGLVWGGGIKRLTGWLHARVKKLLDHELSLYAYHLPLDAHETLGNNAGLADALGVTEDKRPFGDYKGQPIGVAGKLSEPLLLTEFVARATTEVGPPLCFFGGESKHIETVGLCTGGAPELLHEAVDLGLDLFMTGEATEWCKAVAEESGTCFVAGGHHATERFGPKRMAAALRGELGLDATFVDVENPA